MIKLSVLIPVWNQEELVINAIEHLPRRDDIEVLKSTHYGKKTFVNILLYGTEVEI